MIKLIDELMKEFNKYKKVKNNILNYILVNEKDITLKLIQN